MERPDVKLNSASCFGAAVDPIRISITLNEQFIVEVATDTVPLRARGDVTANVGEATAQYFTADMRGNISVTHIDGGSKRTALSVFRSGLQAPPTRGFRARLHDYAGVADDVSKFTGLVTKIVALGLTLGLILQASCSSGDSAIYPVLPSAQPEGPALVAGPSFISRLRGILRQLWSVRGMQPVCLPTF